MWLRPRQDRLLIDSASSVKKSRGLHLERGWCAWRQSPEGWFENKLRRFAMNWDQVAGKWKEFKGQVKQKWGKLTDDDIEVIAGKRDQLAGKLQQRYGYAKDQAEKELDEFTRTLNA
jgi:uncharacterized protein YjbJ (UPF0337 family)